VHCAFYKGVFFVTTCLHELYEKKNYDEYKKTPVYGVIRISN